MSFRPDIEGLRGLAVLTVVAFHAWPGHLPGGFVGVDVFFVLSGYLITGLLMGEVERTGRVDLLAFMSRRVRRLLPSAMLVLACTVLASWGLQDPIQVADTMGAARAAVTFWANEWFAARSLDYFATETAHNPILHYWSLSVEEQFYFLWPCLVGLVAWTGGSRIRIGQLALLVGLVSAGWTCWQVGMDPTGAYYGMTTRAWELAVGGCLASLGWKHDRLIGWLGLILIGIGVTYIGEQWSASIVGVVGTCLILSGGRIPILTVVPLRWLGARSYTLYLWHWPCLVLIPAPPIVSLGVALTLAHWTTKAVERPMIHLKVWQAGLVLVTTCAIAMVIEPQKTQASSPWKDFDQCGWDGFKAPSPVKACWAKRPQQAQQALTLWGDSHAQQWLPAIRGVAERANAELLVMTKSGCPPMIDAEMIDPQGKQYKACEEWQKGSIDQIIKQMPPHSVIIMSARRSTLGTRVEGGDEAFQRGIQTAIDILIGAGMRVVVIRDTPSTPDGFPDSNLDSFTLPPINTGIAWEERLVGVRVVDLNPILCPGGVCPRVGDNGQPVWLNDNHIRASFAATLQDRVINSFLFLY